MEDVGLKEQWLAGEGRTRREIAPGSKARDTR